MLSYPSFIRTQSFLKDPSSSNCQLWILCIFGVISHNSTTHPKLSRNMGLDVEAEIGIKTSKKEPEFATPNSGTYVDDAFLAKVSDWNSDAENPQNCRKAERSFVHSYQPYTASPCTYPMQIPNP